MPFGQAIRNWGQLARFGGGIASKAFRGGYGATAAGAAWGAAAGGAWGAVSGDTSVLGGAMIGAGLGAAGSIGTTIGSRAFGAGMRASARAGRFGYNARSAFMGAAGRRMNRDASVIAGRARNWGAKMYSNMGNKWRTMKSWR